MIKEAGNGITDAEVDQIDGIVNELRTNFIDNRTKKIAFRREMLNSLLRGTNELEQEFLRALHEDMKADAITSYAYNVIYLKNEILDCLDHLDEW
jgi:hypothetical protein